MQKWNDKNIARSRCLGGPLKMGALCQWHLWHYRRNGTAEVTTIGFTNLQTLLFNYRNFVSLLNKTSSLSSLSSLSISRLLVAVPLTSSLDVTVWPFKSLSGYKSQEKVRNCDRSRRKVLEKGMKQQ